MLGAGAQNHKKMTKEEREEAMEGLEMFYRLETGKILDGLGDWAASGPREVPILPWNEWIEVHKEKYQDFSHLIQGFYHLSLEAVENNPRACRLLLRCHTNGRGGFSMQSSLGGMPDDDFYIDKAGNRIGFHKVIRNFCDLETDIRLHLTDRNGNPVFIDTKESTQILRGEERMEDDRLEIYFGMQLPLTCSYSDISGGHIDIRLYGSQDYDLAEIPVSTSVQAESKRVSLGDKTFDVVKIDDMGFVISADEEAMERLDGLNYLYRRDRSYWKPVSSSWMTGNLNDMLKYDVKESEITFEQWLEKKGVDPGNLEATIENFMKIKEEKAHSENEPAIRSKRFNSKMTGDALVLYMPVDSARLLASATVYAPVSGRSAQTTIDEALYRELSDRLYRANLGDTNAPVSGTASGDLFTTAVGKFEYPSLKGAPGQLKEGCRLTAQERDALLAPNNRISYAMGVVQAERLMNDEKMERFSSFFYFPESQELLFGAFESGVRVSKELFEKAGKQADSLYAPNADLTELTEAFREAAEKAKESGEACSTAFDYGQEAFRLYRSCAACDLPQINSAQATGRLLDVTEASQGFKDYIRKHLKMGVQYASSILNRRLVAVEDLGNREPTEGMYSTDIEYVQEFECVRFLDSKSGQPDLIQRVVARIIQLPQKVMEQGISGRVNVEVTIEADGSISDVKDIGSSHPVLAEVVADGLYRIRCTPATVGSQCVAMKLTIPVIFPEL